MTEYLVRHRRASEIFDMVDWCRENFGPIMLDGRNRWIGGRWCYDNDNFKIKFAYSEDAVLFALRWL